MKSGWMERRSVASAPAYHEMTKGIKLRGPQPMGTMPGTMKASKVTRCAPMALLLTIVHAPGAVAATIAADNVPEAAPSPQAAGLGEGSRRDLPPHVHKRRSDNFLRLVGETQEASNPLNTPDRSAEVDLLIGADGQLVSSTVSRPSGFPGFDDAILDVLKDAVPFPKPPLAVRSDDDNLHLHWLFARDQRRCAGVTMTRVYDPIEI